VYCAIDPTAAEKRAVRGVDECVYVERCDVGFQYFNPAAHF
jgi:hypothetical protein